MSIQEIFLNSHGRLRSGWRVAMFAALFIFISGIINVIIIFVNNQMPDDEGARVYSNFIIGNSLVFIAALLIGWFCVWLLENLPFKSLGVSFDQNWFKNLTLGLALGTITILLAAFIGMIFGGLHFQMNQTVSTNTILQSLGTSLLVFAIGSAAEEMIFRGYIFQTLSRSKLAWFAILMTSLFFAVGHLQNPNANYYSTANTFLAGIWLGAAYLKTRTLWFPFALHFAWNWVQGQFLGIPVSGLRLITPAPILQAVNEGPVWLTGGNYGIEGGLACTIALVTSILLIWLSPIFRPTDEMFALTSEENPKPRSRGDAEDFLEKDL